MDWLKSYLPLTLFPGIKLVLWIEACGAPGMMFTVERLKLIITWW